LIYECFVHMNFQVQYKNKANKKICLSRCDADFCVFAKMIYI